MKKESIEYLHNFIIDKCLNHFNTEIDYYTENDVYFYNIQKFSENYKIPKTRENWFNGLTERLDHDQIERHRHIITTHNDYIHINMILFINYMKWLDNDLYIDYGIFD